MHSKKIYKIMAVIVALAVVAPVGAFANEDGGEGQAAPAAAVLDTVEETEPETEPETVPETEPETEPDTEPDTEPETEKETEKETEPETEKESEKETEKETDKKEDKKDEDKKDDDKKEEKTNDSLIESQNIVVPPEIIEDFRFYVIDKAYAIAQKDVTVYEKMDEKSDEVGALKEEGLAYILKEEDDGWVYLESALVRGFAKADAFLTGDEAAKAVEVNKAEADEDADEEDIDETALEEENFTLAEVKKEVLENEARTHTKTTVYDIVADKVFAVNDTEEKIAVLEGKDEEARVIGELPAGGLCYVLEDTDEEWYFVESDDVRGFVNPEDLLLGEDADKAVEEKGEDKFALAKELVDWEENEALYYTLTSIKEGNPESAVRTAIIEFALQFVGNRYVWGGTSLTSGADCSGFVQSIYKEFGYSLPRVAAAQSQYGMQIPIESAEPGDLIFYAKNGYVYHVSMYIGDGQIVHASNSKTGIITSGIGPNAVWATRVLKDE